MRPGGRVMVSVVAQKIQIGDAPTSEARRLVRSLWYVKASSDLGRSLSTSNAMLCCSLTVELP